MARKKKQHRVAHALEQLTGGKLTTVSRMRQRASEAFNRGAQFGGEDEPPPTSKWVTRWGYAPHGRQKTRDVTAMTYPEAVEKVWKQYCGNPVARRLNLLRRDLILDANVRPQASDEKVQEVIDRFWDDPVNDMGTFVFQFGLQIGLFGTQCITTFVSREEQGGGVVGSGLVRLGYVDPGQIEDIVLDPDNARIPVAVVEDRGMDGKRFYRVIHVDDDPQSDTYGRLIGVRRRAEDGGRRPTLEDFQWVTKQDVGPKENKYRAIRVREFDAPYQVISRKGGEYAWEDEEGVPYDGACFLFRVNDVMNSKFGWPDTLHLCDWLDQADMFFFDIAERIFFLTAFVWDVLYEGLDEDEIAEKVRELPTPTRGSIQAHNESVKWSAVTPDLGQVDMETAARVLLYFIASIGFGVPETWLGASQTTRYAGAKEAVAPARKILEARQSYIQSCIVQMVQFQIDQAIRAGQLPEGVDDSFTVEMPEISKEDIGELASTLKVVAEGLMIALGAGIIKRPTAVKALHKIVDAMGVDIDPADLEELTLEEVREMRDTLRVFQQLEVVPLGAPLELKDLLGGAEITEEDLERVRREWGEFLRLAGIEEEEGGG